MNKRYLRVYKDYVIKLQYNEEFKPFVWDYAYTNTKTGTVYYSRTSFSSLESTVEDALGYIQLCYYDKIQVNRIGLHYKNGSFLINNFKSIRTFEVKRKQIIRRKKI